MIVERKSVGDTYSLLADILLKSGDTDSALRYAQEGLTKGGSATSLENDIGNILSAKGDLRNANEHYLKSLKAGRSDGWPEINMAQNLADLGEIDSAESWFMRGLKGKPRDGSEYAEYINDYAWFLAIHRAGDNKKVQEALALSELSNVLTQRSNPNFLDTLAECQAVNGKLSEAVTTEREALRLVTDDHTTQQKYASRVAHFEKKMQDAGGGFAEAVESVESVRSIHRGRKKVPHRNIRPVEKLNSRVEAFRGRRAHGFASHSLRSDDQHNDLRTGCRGSHKLSRKAWQE